MRRHVLSYFEMLAEPVVTRKDIYGGQQLIGQLSPADGQSLTASGARRCHCTWNATGLIALFFDPSVIPHRRGGQGKGAPSTRGLLPSLER
jgi:hypothetical protein